MDDKKINYDYSKGGEEYRDEEWVNLKTGKKELIRLPLGRSFKEMPLMADHVRLSTYNYWKQMNNCKLPKEINYGD